MKMDLHNYLNARLKLLSNRFEECKKGKYPEADKWEARRIMAQADELELLAESVEEAETSFKEFFKSLSESINDWLYKA